MAQWRSAHLAPAQPDGRTTARPDPDHRFLDAARLAGRTAARLGETIRAELEAARLAAGGQDLDPVAARRSRAQHVLQVVFEIVAAQAQLAGERRDERGSFESSSWRWRRRVKGVDGRRVTSRWRRRPASASPGTSGSASRQLSRSFGRLGRPGRVAGRAARPRQAEQRRAAVRGQLQRPLVGGNRLARPAGLQLRLAEQLLGSQHRRRTDRRSATATRPRRAAPRDRDAAGPRGRRAVPRGAASGAARVRTDRQPAAPPPAPGACRAWLRPIPPHRIAAIVHW